MGNRPVSWLQRGCYSTPFLNGKDLEHNKRLLEAINETAFHEHCVFEGDFIFSMEGDNVTMKLKRYP